MFVRLMVTDIHAQRTSDSQDGPLGIFGVLDDTDEDYFLVEGASYNEGGFSSRITPPQSDHYDISGGQTLHNIILWEGFVGVKKGVFLTVAILDRTNVLWNTILNIAETAGLAAGAFLLEDPNLGAAALKKLSDSASEFVANLQHSGDKVLGAFSVLITCDGENAQFNWKPTGDFTQLLNVPTDSAVTFNITGAKCIYQVNVGVETLQLPMIVNVNSGKCLDVPLPDGTAEGDAGNVQIQQYTINGGSNQRWFLKPLGPTLLRIQAQQNVNLGAASFFGFFPVVYFAVMNSLTGKALDVRGGSAADQAPIQQFKSHSGPDQQFALMDIPGQDGSLIINVASGRCLDVADASRDDHGLIQQFVVNGQANQRWRTHY